jgi:DNA-directed RNA polymerase specialized sigma24 family protein
VAGVFVLGATGFKAKRVLGMHARLSYRLIARNLGLSKNTVMDIVKRGRMHVAR